MESPKSGSPRPLEVLAGALISGDRDRKHLSRGAIGGEREWSCFEEIHRKGRRHELLCRNGTWTISGRTALVVVLQELRKRGITRVDLPAFLCRSIVEAVGSTGTPYAFFPVGQDLSIDPPEGRGRATLVIDYFGWPSGLRQGPGKAGAARTAVHDRTHSLLSRRKEELRSEDVAFASLRKIGEGVIGGWTSIPEVDMPRCSRFVLNAVWQAIGGRLLKGAYLAEAEDNVLPVVEDRYLRDFNRIERVVETTLTPMSLPDFVRRRFERSGWESIAAARRANWILLERELRGSVDVLYRSLPDAVVPLGFVIRSRKRDALRAALRRERIFAPVHWELPREVDGRRYRDAADLARSCLTLPVDERYGRAEMYRVAEVIRRNI
jgi:hypothetical protein